MRALLICQVLRLGVFAAVILDLYLSGVFLHNFVKANSRFRIDDALGKGESDALGAVVEIELAAHEQLQLGEELLDRPMRESASILRSVPRIRESVAYKEVLVFLFGFPVGEVVGIPDLLAYLLGYI